MPRIEKPQDPEVPKAIEAIEAFCLRNSMTVNALAEKTGVSQPALCRFLAGNRKTLTSTAVKVLGRIHTWHNASYANPPTGVLDKDTAHAIIVESALKLWDGDPSTSHLLSDFLTAVHPLYKIFLKQRTLS